MAVVDVTVILPADCPGVTVYIASLGELVNPLDRVEQAARINLPLSGEVAKLQQLSDEGQEFISSLAQSIDWPLQLQLAQLGDAVFILSQVSADRVEATAQAMNRALEQLSGGDQVAFQSPLRRPAHVQTMLPG